jgi:hypothetical protein
MCSLQGALTTWDLCAPGAGIELGEDSLDLPSGGGGVQVGGLEDVDTLDGRSAEAGGPAEGNGVTGDGVDVQDGESDGALRSLAADEGVFGGECGGAKRVASQEVDRVRGVGEVGRQQCLGHVDVEVGQEGREAAHELARGGAGQAVYWWAWRTCWWWWWPGGRGRGRGRGAWLRHGGRKAGQGRDDNGAGEELHFECLGWVVC